MLTHLTDINSTFQARQSTSFVALRSPEADFDWLICLDLVLVRMFVVCTLEVLAIPEAMTVAEGGTL